MKTFSHLACIALAASCLLAAEPPFQPRAKRDAAPPTRVPDGVKAHRDIAYVENGHARQKLDLYVPEKAATPLPLIIWVHGGGWAAGSKDQCQPLRNGYTERGYALASIGYRLSGDAIFPAQIEDCKAAIRWLRAHAKQYGLNPDRFGAWGSSAGGHLVALLGTSGGVKEFDVGAHLDQSSRVQAVCDYYGPTDLLQMDAHALADAHLKHDLPASPESRLIGGPIQENKEKAARVNPIAYVTPDDPPFLIVHGDKDPLVPIHQSQLLFEALKKTGVSVRFHTIHGAGHGQGFGGREIDEMVGSFFDRCLKGTAAIARDATQTESVASAMPQTKAGVEPRGPRMGWAQVRAIEGVADDGRVTRDKFKGPPPLFDRLDRNRDGVLTKEDFDDMPPAAPTPAPESRSAPAPSTAVPTGLLYFASYQQRDNPAPAANPHLLGAVFTIYWSDVEKSEGVLDWSDLDRRIAVWAGAGKKVALRIMWSSSGNWPEPAAKRPTPQFVLNAGAVTVRSESSKTDIPLFWDPVYRKHASRFLREVARKFDGNPNVLFIDVTPGAETNPYRFRRINVAEPEFKQRFLAAAASDGRKYSHELWLATVKQGVDDAVAAFKRTPLLVTLNVGSLDGPEQFQAIGEHCVSRGCYVGQNGLNARSYDGDSSRKAAFQRWNARTRFYFEMVDASGGGTGSLMDVMKAAERVGCNYLGVYAVDVLRGTKGQSNYDPAFEAALAYGAKVIGKTTVPAAPSSPAAQSNLPAGRAAKNLALDGERWTYRDGAFEMNGVLLKPEGNGPFPAVLISHGLGGSAESFGLNKAREFVKWGLVCIAPNYTHNVRGATRGGGQRGAHPPDYGASEENLRRARACVEILRGLAYVDNKRIAAYGHSMGGFVTIGLAATVPDLLKAAAITGSGVAPRAGYPAPSAELAAKIRAPFLILHGGNDPVVRPEQSASLKEVLDRNRVPNERRVFDGEGHAIDQSKREEVFNAIRDWFRRHGVLQP